MAIFRFNHFQANNLRPEDIMNKPRHPEDISNRPGESETFLQCNSMHRIRRIYICFNLPYLEPHAIKLQQLFSYQLKHDLSTFQTIKKVLRKLSYPLKPSRYKKNQVSHLEPKSHKRLQRLVSDFVSHLICFLSFYIMTVGFSCLSII